MGINCNEWRNNIRIEPNKPRKTGKGASKGVPIIPKNGENWAIMIVDKKIVHKYGLLHEAAHIVIISGDGKKILLQQRGKAKRQWKEYWDIIGEHLVFGDRVPLNSAKNAFQVELGKKWRKPSYEFDVKEELNYNNNHDYESRPVYVIIADDINESVVETMNREFGEIEEDKQETIQFKWFDKAEFDSYLLNKKIVPYTYWENCNSYTNFKDFFREKAKVYRAKNDLEDAPR